MPGPLGVLICGCLLLAALTVPSVVLGATTTVRCGAGADLQAAIDAADHGGHHKEGRALRTETVIKDAHDFGIGKRLVNLPALREVGSKANRRLLDVQRISHDPILGQASLDRLTQPALVDGQRASALRFGDGRAQTLLSALVIFRLQPHGFRATDLRAHLAPLLGLVPEQLSQGHLSYAVRRLRLHGLIKRIPRSHRYRVTQLGLRSALFFTRAYARLLRPGFAQLSDPRPSPDTRFAAPSNSSSWPSTALLDGACADSGL